MTFKLKKKKKKKKPHITLQSIKKQYTINAITSKTNQKKNTNLDERFR